MTQFGSLPTFLFNFHPNQNSSLTLSIIGIHIFGATSFFASQDRAHLSLLPSAPSTLPKTDQGLDALRSKPQSPAFLK